MTNTSTGLGLVNGTLILSCLALTKSCSCLYSKSDGLVKELLYRG